MPCLGCGVTELKEIIGHLWRPSHLASPLQAQDENIKHKTIILEDEGRKLETTNHTVRICMRHVLVSEDSVVFRGDVIGQIVVQNETKQSVEQSQIDLLVNLGVYGLHHNVTFSFACLPDVGQVVDALAPLVYQKGWRLRICGLDPCGEKTPFICFEEQELIKVGVRDLLDWLDVITGNELVVCVEKLDARFLKRPLGKQKPLDTG